MDKNTKVFIGLGGAAVLFTIGHFSDSNTPAPTPAPTSTVVQTPEPTLSEADLYLAEVKVDGGSRVSAQPDSALLEIGYQTCSVLDDGNTVMDMVLMLLQDDPDDAAVTAYAAIIGNAIEHFCPEYTYQVDMLSTYA